MRRYPRICLTIIVKNELESNEEHVILRCLESCKDVISSVAMVVTAAPGLGWGNCEWQALEWCTKNHKQLFLERYSWDDDFARARNVSLALAAGKSDWCLIIDSDEMIVAPFTAQLFQDLLETSKDCCVVPMLLGGQVNPRAVLIRNIPGWAYTLAHHETLELNGQPITHPVILGNVLNPRSGPYLTTPSDGARSLDPLRREKDIAKLKTMTDERSRFFLGISLMNNGQREEAVGHLEAFMDMPDGKAPFRYYAALCLGRLQGGDTKWFKIAMDLCPDRPEALCEMATAESVAGNWNMTRIYALGALHSAPPVNLVYLEPRWLQWASRLILSVAYINLGWTAQALPYLEWLIKSPNLPENKRPIVQALLDAASQSL